MKALAWFAAVLAVVLTGCPKGGGLVDPLSPAANVQVTAVTAPGGALLAPLLSSTAGTTATAEFPPLTVGVTVFNGVSTTLIAYGVEYRQEDGLTPLGLQPFNAALSQFIQAELVENGFKATSLSLTLPVVSGELRSFFAGPDNLLGTDDDYRSNVTGLITLVGSDINGHTVTANGQVSITARPQAPAD